MKVDASMNKVKGLPKGKKTQLDQLARQVENRQMVMERVNALVARAQATAAQLAKANKNNTALLAQIAADSAMIADLNSTIQRQTATIEGLSVRIDSLKSASQQLATTLASVETESAKAFVVVGREDDLRKRA
jgi:chromosome segregation ATPase